MPRFWGSILAKTVVFVVLSVRTERTKEPLKGVPLRIPRKTRKSSQQPHRFFAKARRCKLLLKYQQQHCVGRMFEVANFRWRRISDTKFAKSLSFLILPQNLQYILKPISMEVDNFYVYAKAREILKRETSLLSASLVHFWASRNEQ